LGLDLNLSAKNLLNIVPVCELLQLRRLDMKQREELQRGREVESESMKSDLSDCQTPFYSSTRGGQQETCR
ncbi:hypothetical protein NQZ68_039421, partial [Dissostichus eleginoides]